MAQSIAAVESDQIEVFTWIPHTRTRPLTTSTGIKQHPLAPPPSAPKTRAFSWKLANTTERSPSHHRIKGLPSPPDLGIARAYQSLPKLYHSSPARTRGEVTTCYHEAFRKAIGEFRHPKPLPRDTAHFIAQPNTVGRAETPAPFYF